MSRMRRGTLRTLRTLGVFGLAVAAGSFAAGRAHAESCEPHAIDLGGGKSVMGGCGQLKIAFLDLGTNNVYLQAGIKGAQDAAKAGGATLEVFDAGWTASTQYNQAQNVVTGGQFNGVLAEMANGVQVCKLLTQDAPAKGILVAVANQPLCDRALKEGTEYWSPGTINYVGGTQGLQSWRDTLAYIAKENPGPQRVALLTGPDLIVQTIAIDLAMKEIEAKYPDFKMVAEVRTDYSLPQANAKTGPLLQGHPDLTILISNYSDLTRGAVSAIKQAGMMGKLKIYDNGGSTWAFQAVRDGEIVSTRTYTPYTEMKKGVESIVAAWKGEPTPRYVPLESVFITKANVDNYKPEY